MALYNKYKTKREEATNKTKQKIKHVFIQGLHDQTDSSTPI